MAEARIAGFGFSTGGAAPDLSDLDSLLGRIEDSGATFAELALCGLDVVAGGRVIAERRRRLERICAGRRLRYTVHGALGANFMDEARLPLHETVCGAMLELTEAVGADVMVHHAGIVAAAPPPMLDRLHAIERDALRRIAEVAGRRGVRIAVECLFVDDLAQYTADPARLAREIEAIGHDHVVATLDFSHAALTTSLIGMDYEAAVRALAPVSGHLHVHDSFGRPRAPIRDYGPAEQIAFGMGDLHLPMGWGDIPWDRILPGLPVRPGTALIVELPLRFWSEIESVAATARDFVATINRG